MTVEDPRLTQIRALHVEGKVPENGFNQGWGMTWCERDHEAWPCATVRVLGAPPVDATPPQGIDRDAAEDLLNEVWADCRANRFTISQWVDRIEALVRPVEGVVLTPGTLAAELAADVFLTGAEDRARDQPEAATELRALAARLGAAQ